MTDDAELGARGRGRDGQGVLRVAYVDHCARLSGGELALLRLLPALAHVTPQVVLAEDGPLAPELSAAGVEVTVLKMAERVRALPRAQVRRGARAPVAAVGATAYALRLARHLRRLEVDLVHTNSLKAAVYGGLAGRLAGVPVIWHIRDRISGDYLPPAAVGAVHGLLRWLPQAVIVNSRATRDTLAAHHRSPPIHVVNDPVVVPARGPRPPEGPFTVGILGRIAPWKGQDLFLRAFAAAFPDGPERAVVVGAPLFEEHDYDSRLRSLVEELGIAQRVEFRGFRRDVAAELARLHALVHASVIPEPFGQVVVEGMAAGLPVLAADAGGPAEVVTHDVDGLLYPIGDVEALASALSRLGRDPSLRARLGGAGVERARRFAPDIIAAEVGAIYDAVLHGRRHRRREPEGP